MSHKVSIDPKPSTYKQTAANDLSSGWMSSWLGLFKSFFSSEASDKKVTPSFESQDFHWLSIDATNEIAHNYLNTVFEPHYDLAKKIVEQLSPQDHIGEALHVLATLSSMEKQISNWRKRHLTSPLNSPKKVYLLYQKLFHRVTTITSPDQPIPSQSVATMPRLANDGLINCSINVVLHTLFYNVNLAKELIFSPKQTPELLQAFLVYQRALHNRDLKLLDLASHVREGIEFFKDKRQHDVAEVLCKILEHSQQDSPLFSLLERKTTLENIEKYSTLLATPLKDGCLQEDVREAVYTIEVPLDRLFLLEDLLFTSFNEVVTDETPVVLDAKRGVPPLELRRTNVQTRYVTAPKFLIYNLSRSQYTDQPFKNRNFVGVQRFFFLNRHLTVDNRGAKYRLLSFNTHIGESPTAGHYLHYREVDQAFLRLDDSKIDPISEVEYLLEAQSAYVLVFERIDKPLSDIEFELGMEENRESFDFLIFLNNLLAALNGQVETLDDELRDFMKPILCFMKAVVNQDPLEESFSALPDEIQSHVLTLWSEDLTLATLPSTLLKHAKKDFLLPSHYSEKIFSGNGQLLLSMMDLVARRAKEAPKERAFSDIQLFYQLVIHASGKLALDFHQSYQDCFLFQTTVIREVGQVALTVGVHAFKHRCNPKALNPRELSRDAQVVMQGLCSISQCLFSYLDPRKENSYVKFATKYLHPVLKVGQSFFVEEEGKLQRYAPLIAPLTDLGFSALEKGLGHEISAETQSLTSTSIDVALTYRLGTTHDRYLQVFSTIYSWITPPISERLQGETNPLRWRTRTEAVQSNLFHVLFTNVALQSLITHSITNKWLEGRVSPLKEQHQSTYAELRGAIEHNDAPKIRSLLNEINQLNQQLKNLGVRLDQEKYAQETFEQLLELDRKNLKLNEYYVLYQQLTKASNKEEEKCLVEKLKAKEEELLTLGIELPPHFSIQREQEIERKIQGYNALVEGHQHVVSEKDHEKAEECQTQLLKLQRELEALGVTFESFTPQTETPKELPPIIPDPLPTEIHTVLSPSSTSNEIRKDTESRKEKFYRVFFTIDGQTREIGQVKSREAGNKLIEEFNVLVKKRDALKVKILTYVKNGLQNGMKASEIPSLPDLSFPKFHIDAPTENGKLKKNDHVIARFEWAQWVNPFEKCRAELKSEIQAWEKAAETLVTTFNSQITPFVPVILDYQYTTEEEGKGNRARYRACRNGNQEAICRVYDEKSRSDCILFDKNVAASVNELNHKMFQQRLLAKQLGIPGSELPPPVTLSFPRFGIFVTGETVRVQLDGVQIYEKKGKDAYSKAFEFLQRKRKEIFEHYETRTNKYCNAVKALFPPLHVRHQPHSVSFVAGNKESNKYVYEITSHGHQIPHGPFPTFESRDAYRRTLCSSKISFDDFSAQLDHLQEQALASGIPFEDLPPKPPLFDHDYQVQDDGKHVKVLKNGTTYKQWPSDTKGHDSAQSELSQQLNLDTGRNREIVQAHKSTLEQLTPTPLTQPPKLTPFEREKRAAVLIPPAKKEKEHGFFYRAYRAVRSAPDRLENWLNNHGVELSMEFRSTSKLYKVKTPSESAGPRHHLPSREPIETHTPIEHVSQPFTYDPTLQIPFDPNTPLIIPNPIQPQLSTAIPPRNPVRPPENLNRGVIQNQSSFSPADSLPSTKKPKESFLSKLKPKPQVLAEPHQGYGKLFIRHFLNPDRSLDYRERIEQNTVLFTAHAKDVLHTAGFLADVGQNIYNFVDNTAHGRLEFALDRSQSKWIDAWMDKALPRIDPKAELSASIANELYLQVFTGGGAALVRLQRAGLFFKKVTVITSKSIRAGLRNPSQIGKLPLLTEKLAITSQNTTLRETAARLIAQRKIVQIKPIKIPPLQKGAELSWWKQNLPKLEKLTRHLEGKPLYKGIRKEFASQHLSENQVRRILDHAGYKTYPRPKGLQSGFSVELSDKVAGMIYRKVGTTEKQNILVRVMQGTRKENVVTATIKGNPVNGRWRQQTPYVTQRRGKEYLTRDGRWIIEDDPAITHIPLEIFEFKGW